MADRDAESIAAGLAEVHGCHTVILYGSRARGDATAASDFDLVCIREQGPKVRDARWSDGAYIDAFVYSESDFATLGPDMLRILGGKVLFEREGFGTALLERVRAIWERGPDALPADQHTMLITWSAKMLDRISGPATAESSYRRVWLLYQALEDYFSLRQIWYRGPKEAFAWLAERDPGVFALFETALRPEASLEQIAALARTVYDVPVRPVSRTRP